MPWKDGKGKTTEICIYPPTATIQKNDFSYRLSSAPVEQDGPFSTFSSKQRFLTPIKGAGFQLNSNVYEKFEVAQFSGDEKIQCSLLKGPVLDFGIIFDPAKVKAHFKILHLKSDMSFALDPALNYFVTVLDGELAIDGKPLIELETLHYQNESQCQLKVAKNAVVFFLSLLLINES